jgi:hypothetical protein
MPGSPLHSGLDPGVDRGAKNLTQGLTGHVRGPSGIPTCLFLGCPPASCSHGHMLRELGGGLAWEPPGTQ